MGKRNILEIKLVMIKFHSAPLDTIVLQDEI